MAHPAMRRGWRGSLTVLAPGPPTGPLGASPGVSVEGGGADGRTHLPVGHTEPERVEPV
jgi:hypothetical protein